VNDKIVYAILLMMAVILESVLVYAGVELWKMKEKFPSVVFFAMFAVSSAALGYALIGGLLR